MFQFRQNHHSLYVYLGNETSAMYIKSVFETITGIWGLGIDSILDDGLPLVTSISITNWRFVSHLTGSPSNTIAI